MLVNREVAFMTSISVFPKKYSRSFAIVWYLLAKNYTQKRFVDLVRNNIVNGYRNTCVDPRNCYTCNNS